MVAGRAASAPEALSCAHPCEPLATRGAEAGVTVLSPRRLLDVDGAASYLSMSRWTIYDLIKGGVLPTVKVPSVRADLGPRKTGNPKSRRRVLARPDFRQPLRKILLDVRDLDAFVDGLPHETDPLT
jgi:predicted DNA-binding transcriptional regulator AlpA